MADQEAPEAPESMAEVMQAITQNLPAFMQAMNSQVRPQARTELDVAKEISPEYQQLQADLYKMIAPQLANTGAEIDRQSRLKTAKTDAEILDTSGRDLARIYREVDQSINPEYYATREAASRQLGNLLSEDLNAPDIAAERLINQENERSGNANNPSATNTVSNALSFGDEKAKRSARIGNAISQATAFLQPASNAAFNPFTASTNKNASNTGVSQFGGVQQPGQTAYNAGNNLLGSSTALQQSSMDINANRRDILDRVNESVTSLGNLV